MKRQNIFHSTIIMLALFSASTLGWAQTEAVSGTYDTANDWFVFTWTDPQDGKVHSVFDPGNKVKPDIHALVSFDASSSTFTYSYQVNNLAGARQALEDIFIRHLSAVSDATAPAPSNEWNMGEYQNKGVWSWAKTRGAVHGIPAGQGVRGASFKSKGLPAIVDTQFSGLRRGEYIIPGDDSPDDIEQSFDRAYASLKAKYPDKWADIVAKKTVGPLDPPATFNAASAIQNLIALVNQSRTQGWIDNDGIVNSLLTKLNTAQSKLPSNTKTAKNILNAFMNDVSAQNGKHLTSEAYALLYFNAQYAVNHM